MSEEPSSPSGGADGEFKPRAARPVSLGFDAEAVGAPSQQARREQSSSGGGTERNDAPVQHATMDRAAEEADDEAQPRHEDDLFQDASESATADAGGKKSGFGRRKTFAAVNAADDDTLGAQGRGAWQCWWWPYPRRHQKVKADDPEPVDPFLQPTLTWWFPYWVIWGGDPEHFVPHPEHYDYLRNKFSWPRVPYPSELSFALATEHYLAQQSIVKKLEIKTSAGKTWTLQRFNLQTLFKLLGITALLQWTRHKSQFFFWFLVTAVVFIIPTAMATWMVGAIPLGSANDPCSFSQQLVFVLWQNPIVQVAKAFVMCHLCFASVDPSMPWRPFHHYALILLATYGLQVALCAPIFATTGSFSMLGIVVNLLTFLTVVIGLTLSRSWILNYNTDADTSVMDVKALYAAAFAHRRRRGRHGASDTKGLRQRLRKWKAKRDKKAKAAGEWDEADQALADELTAADSKKSGLSSTSGGSSVSDDTFPRPALNVSDLRDAAAAAEEENPTSDLTVDAAGANADKLMSWAERAGMGNHEDLLAMLEEDTDDDDDDESGLIDAHSAASSDGLGAGSRGHRSKGPKPHTGWVPSAPEAPEAATTPANIVADAQEALEATDGGDKAYRRGRTALRAPEFKRQKTQFRGKFNTTESKWERMKLYFLILFIMHLFIIFLYAYSYGFTQVSDGVRTALSFILFIPETIYRKVVQHITSKPTQAIFHSDMTFILSGFFVYTALALYAAFNSSNESEGKDSVGDLMGVYVGLFFSTVAPLLISPIHLTSMWFRFRCWIKTWGINIFKGRRCNPRGDNIDSLALPLDYECDIDGRGTSNAHPDYLRAKQRFAIAKFIGVGASYATYLVISPILRWGPNSDYYPYSERDPCLPQQVFTVRTFSDSQYWASFGFSGVALVSAIVLLYVYIKVTKFYWPVLYPFTKALQEVLATHSERMGFYVLVFSWLLFDTLIMVNINYRVWFASDGGSSLGTSRTCPLPDVQLPPGC